MYSNVQLNFINLIKVIATMCVFCLHTALFSLQQSGFWFSEKTWFLQTPAWAAVWVFFFLSGYLNGGNFIGKEAKYNFTFKSVCMFYIKRFYKVIFPTWIFIFIACSVAEPELVNNKSFVMRILTFRYYNEPSSMSMGATWYVFVLTQLYILTPIICYIINVCIKRKRILFSIILLVFVCLCGMIFRYSMYKKGAPWSQDVYVPFYANLDIYISGILMAAIKEKRMYQKDKYLLYVISSITIFCLLILVNIWVYYEGNFESKYILLYQYLFPSIYIIILSIVTYLGCGWNVVYTSKNPLIKMFDFFANISFEFYLVHSMVLYKISPYINAETPNRYHIKLLGISFLVSVLWALILKGGYMSITKKLLKTEN